MAAKKSSGLVRIAEDLVEDLAPLRFGPPVECVYNPLVYAWRPHKVYLERYGAGPKRTLFFGMNPGPWGMAQTGVPFGEITVVRDWLGITGKVDKPEKEHPERPIEGFDCARREVSGARLWGWVKETFETPERFFAQFFIANYCPLTFMEASGKNRTPDKLPARERDLLLAACDKAIRRTVEHLGATTVIGVGGFAEARAKAALEGLPVAIGRILHPSPASPLANQGWGESVTRELGRLGLLP